MSSRSVVTVGYEGRTLAEFVAALRKARVRRVVDVRELPLSRRKGFSKTKLGETLRDAGIEYFHFRDAGNPYRDQRGDIERCLREYRRHIAKRPQVIEQLAELTSEKKTALLCVEADPSSCHRSVLVQHMATRQKSLVVEHI